MWISKAEFLWRTKPEWFLLIPAPFSGLSNLWIVEHPVAGDIRKLPVLQFGELHHTLHWQNRLLARHHPIGRVAERETHSPVPPARHNIDAMVPTVHMLGDNLEVLVIDDQAGRVCRLVLRIVARIDVGPSFLSS